MASASPVFLDPPQCNGIVLDAKIVEQYNEKMRCYQIFEPHYLRVGDEISLWKELGAEPVRMTVQEYNAAKMWLEPSKKTPFLFTKPGLHDGYMWKAEAKRIPADKLDDLDRAFLKDPEKLEGATKHQLYGYHTYGGYYGFFRPDLNEVIHLVASVLPVDKLAGVKRIYVTTDAYPSDKISECYDSKKDMHKALTTCYIVQ